MRHIVGAVRAEHAETAVPPPSQQAAAPGASAPIPVPINDEPKIDLKDANHAHPDMLESICGVAVNTTGSPATIAPRIV